MIRLFKAFNWYGNNDFTTIGKQEWKLCRTRKHSSRMHTDHAVTRMSSDRVATRLTVNRMTDTRLWKHYLPLQSVNIDQRSNKPLPKAMLFAVKRMIFTEWNDFLILLLVNAQNDICIDIISAKEYRHGYHHEYHFVNTIRIIALAASV